MINDATRTQTAMEGAGYYNRHSSAQAAGIEQMLKLLEEAANQVVVGGETLVVAAGDSAQLGRSWANTRR